MKYSRHYDDNIAEQKSLWALPNNAPNRYPNWQYPDNHRNILIDSLSYLYLCNNVANIESFYIFMQHYCNKKNKNYEINKKKYFNGLLYQCLLW